jgi:hypothetical protein
MGYTSKDGAILTAWGVREEREITRGLANEFWCRTRSKLRYQDARAGGIAQADHEIVWVFRNCRDQSIKQHFSVVRSSEWQLAYAPAGVGDDSGSDPDFDNHFHSSNLKLSILTAEILRPTWSHTITPLPDAMESCPSGLAYLPSACCWGLFTPYELRICMAG